MKRQCRIPVVAEIGETVVAKDPTTGEVRQLSLYDQIGPWTLMAMLDLGLSEAIAVFEELETRTGSMVFTTQEGPVLELSKTLEPTYVSEESCYRGHAKAEIINAERDVLREEFLALGRDPTFEEVAACFPPIRRVKYGDKEGPHTFVGSRNCVDIVPIYYYALEGSARVNPGIVAPEIKETVEQGRIWEGLVGGWLPVVRFAYPVREGLMWDTLTFGVVDPPTTFIQPAWYRFLRLEDGRITEAHYLDSYLPYPWMIEPEPQQFYVELYKLHGYWSETLEGVMELQVPAAWVSDFCRHAMVQEMITRVGDHPRYGVVDRAYGAPEHDGFQDVLNSSVSCYLEWGLFDIARGYLENYLTHFVRADGSIDYRGPEIGQYARMLVILAQYYEYTGDLELLLNYDQKIMAISQILLTRREEAKQRSQDDPAYGLIVGRHEADISFVNPTLGTMDYEQPYFSNSTQAWRGLRDLGLTWMTVGERRDDLEWVARGKALVKEAAELRKDVYRAIELSILYDGDLPHLPVIAGSKRSHGDAPFRSCPESYDENRVWSEMMHSGMVTPQTVELILAYAATAHKGSILSIFTNRQLAVAFQCYMQAYGLIQHDMIHELLLLFYAHATHLHTRGTWSVLECVDMDRDRAEHLPYCVPAQMTIPIITKWMLVFEDPLSPTLWLAKATPRAWLGPGERIKVDDAPTRWGKVSYTLSSHLDQGEVRATVALPHAMPAETKVRFRIPEGWTLSGVEVNDRTWGEFDPVEETVRIPRGTGGVVEIRATYEPH
jgi:hypothetical protein